MAVLGYAAKLSNADVSHFRTGFCGTGKTRAKSSDRTALAIMRRTSEKAKLSRPLTAWRRWGLSAKLAA